MNHREKNTLHNRGLCVAAVVWLILAANLPLYEVWAVVLTLIATGVAYFVAKGRAIK